MKTSEEKHPGIDMKKKPTVKDLSREAKKWDGRKGEKNLKKNLKKEGWVDAPERLPRGGNHGP